MNMPQPVLQLEPTPTEAGTSLFQLLTSANDRS